MSEMEENEFNGAEISSTDQQAALMNLDNDKNDGQVEMTGDTDSNTNNSVTNGGDRNKLIAAATVFLNNKKVRDSPTHLKRAFLERKGLTPEEIRTAFSLSDTLSSDTKPSLPPQVVPATFVEVESVWKKSIRFVASTVAFTGTALVLFEIFQRYINPWLLRDNRELMEKVIEGQAELNENISSAVSAVNDLRRQLAKNSEDKVKNLSNKINGVNEIKEDLKSLKSIMLSRNQFPPIPVSKPALPSWQLETRPTSLMEPQIDHKVIENGFKDGGHLNKDEEENGEELKDGDMLEVA